MQIVLKHVLEYAVACHRSWILGGCGKLDKGNTLNPKWVRPRQGSSRPSVACSD
jgi:hypothetical protein